jgi:hypothetical protein
MTNQLVLVLMLVCICLLIVSTLRLMRDMSGAGPGRKENERLRQALQWYASPENWRNRVPDLTGVSPADRDHGAMARYTLTGDSAKKEGTP